MGISPRYNKQEHNRRKKLRDRGQAGEDMETQNHG